MRSFNSSCSKQMKSECQNQSYSFSIWSRDKKKTLQDYCEKLKGTKSSSFLTGINNNVFKGLHSCHVKLAENRRFDLFAHRIIFHVFHVKAFQTLRVTCKGAQCHIFIKLIWSACMHGLSYLKHNNFSPNQFGNAYFFLTIVLTIKNWTRQWLGVE